MSYAQYKAGNYHGEWETYEPPKAQMMVEVTEEVYAEYLKNPSVIPGVVQDIWYDPIKLCYQAIVLV